MMIVQIMSAITKAIKSGRARKISRFTEAAEANTPRAPHMLVNTMQIKAIKAKAAVKYRGR